MSKWGSNSELFAHENDALTARPQLHFILVKLSFEVSMQATLSTAELFITLGFFVHPEKSQLIPSQKITFLGFVIDSVNMTITVTEKRYQTFKTLLNIILKIKRPAIRFVAKVIGHIISILPASKYGALYYRKLENDKILGLHKNAGNFEANLNISSEGFQDLIWWSENLHDITNWIHPPPITSEIKTDASDFAWGGGGGGGVYYDQEIGGSWSSTELNLHINVKEMLAIYFTIKSFCRHLKNKHIKIFSDNTTAIAVINKMPQNLVIL